MPKVWHANEQNIELIDANMVNTVRLPHPIFEGETTNLLLSSLRSKLDNGDYLSNPFPTLTPLSAARNSLNNNEYHPVIVVPAKPLPPRSPVNSKIFDKLKFLADTQNRERRMEEYIKNHAHSDDLQCHFLPIQAAHFRGERAHSRKVHVIVNPKNRSLDQTIKTSVEPTVSSKKEKTPAKETEQGTCVAQL